MAISRRSGTSWVTPVPKRRSGGAWTNAASVKRRVGTAWVEALYVPVSLSLSTGATGRTFTNAPPSSLPATRTFSTTTAVDGTATGGSGTITYSWTLLSGSTSVSAVSATSASTTFTGTNVPIDGTITAVMRLTATDGITSATADVNVQFTYNSGF